jgi:hypothetical protein
VRALTPDARAVLEDIRDWPCAPLLERFLAALDAIEPPLACESGGLGLRYRAGGVGVCEVSIFAALFLVRVGGDVVEYRVRTADAACAALDAVLAALVAVRNNEVPRAATIVPVRPEPAPGNVQRDATAGNAPPSSSRLQAFE